MSHISRRPTDDRFARLFALTVLSATTMRGRCCRPPRTGARAREKTIKMSSSAREARRKGERLFVQKTARGNDDDRYNERERVQHGKKGRGGIKTWTLCTGTQTCCHSSSTSFVCSKRHQFRFLALRDPGVKRGGETQEKNALSFRRNVLGPRFGAVFRLELPNERWVPV